jgi:hypothetical protein
MIPMVGFFLVRARVKLEMLRQMVCFAGNSQSVSTDTVASEGDSRRSTVRFREH